MMCGGSGAVVGIDADACRVDEEIGAELHASRGREARILKLLLLGAGESGKSTLFKQMRILHGTGYSPDDLRFFKPVLHLAIVSDIQQLLRAALIPTIKQMLGDRLLPEASWPERLKEDVARIAGWRFASFDLTEDRGAAIARVWAYPEIKQVHECRNLFHLSENAEFFFDKIEEISRPGWTPNTEDVIRSRIRSVGIVEQQFTMADGTSFKLVDVGGQRSERRKWSEYDQKCWEDNKTPRMTESLNLFEEICTSPALSQASIIIFLNKADLFREKLLRSPIGKYLPDYQGDGSFSHASEYIKVLFEQVGKKVFKELDQKRSMFFHFTTATDTRNVEAVFRDVQNVVLRATLKRAQLL